LAKPKLYAFSTRVGIACNKHSRTFVDLAEKLKMDGRRPYAPVQRQRRRFEVSRENQGETRTGLALKKSVEAKHSDAVSFVPVPSVVFFLHRMEETRFANRRLLPNLHRHPFLTTMI
jgi:hypothetical protein